VYHAAKSPLAAWLGSCDDAGHDTPRPTRKPSRRRSS